MKEDAQNTASIFTINCYTVRTTPKFILTVQNVSYILSQIETIILAISFSPKNIVKINDDVMSVKCSELFGDVWQKASL